MVCKRKGYKFCTFDSLGDKYILGEASKQIHEYKLKLQKAEQEITNLDGTVSIGSHHLVLSSDCGKFKNLSCL